MAPNVILAPAWSDRMPVWRSTTATPAAVLDELAVERGWPTMITVDNGSEFYSKEMDAWAYRRSVKLDFIRPGKPVENAFIESFTGRLRDEPLLARIKRTRAAGTPRLAA